MSVTQRELSAQRILWKARDQLNQGKDSISVHEAAMRELGRLGFDASDLRFYRNELTKVTGVK